MEEKNKKVIIIGAVVVAIIAVIAVVMMQRPVETPVEAPAEDPVEDPVVEDLIVEEPIFEPDETIDAEFCRQLITRAQLKKITGYEKDMFVFKDKEDVIAPLEIPAKVCGIGIKIEEEKRGISVFLPTVPISYDEFYKKMTKEMAKAIAWGFIPEGIREVQDVGERAFSFSFTMPDSHIISFLEPDTNQVVKIISIIDYETTLNLAKQVEANVIEKLVIPKPVVEDPVAEKPVIEKPVFEPDETIPTEFCRRVITRAQLREITGYEKDRFVFRDRKEEDPVLGRAKKCEIRIYEYEMEKIVIGVLLDNTYEEFYEFMKEKAESIKEKAEGLIPEKIRIRIREIQDVGERAFSFTVIQPEIHMIGLHMIGFVDADTNQVMLVATEEFSYEVALSLTKQVEMNLREQ